jgi:hypothetical protein
MRLLGHSWSRFFVGAAVLAAALGSPVAGAAAPLGQITEFSTGLQAGNASGPNGIAAGADGNIWFTDEGGTRAIGRITPSGQITEFSTGLQAGNASGPFFIAAGAGGNMWFTDPGVTKEIGRITPSGQITEFSTGLQAGNASIPIGIAAGADGNMWFTDQGTTAEIGRIGLGVQAASVHAPSVTGSGQQGTQQVCQGDQWSPWDGILPSASTYSFDGFQWLRDGGVIAGATSQSYTPLAADVAQQLSCTVTVTYALLQRGDNSRDRTDHTDRGDYRVHGRPRARRRPDPPGGGSRRKRLVRCLREHFGGMQDHPDRCDHRVQHGSRQLDRVRLDRGRA